MEIAAQTRGQSRGVYTLKRIALLAVIGASLLALPSSASAQQPNCPDDGLPPAEVNVTSNGLCAVGPAGEGGELVVNPGGCSYINAWSDNPGTPGYAGICTQTTTTDPGCDGIDAGSGSNEGGCFWIKPADPAVNQALQNPVTAMFICGNTSGEDPAASSRDGCSIP
jgi:hypothetical protein